MSLRNVLSVGLILTVLVIAAPAFAQNQDNADVSLATLRQDMRSDKDAIVAEAMQLSPTVAPAFWTVYRAYEGELTKLQDQQFALIKSYAKNYSTMDDSQAETMMKQVFDLQSRRVELRKKYMARFSKAPLTPLTAAKFYQLEYRLELMNSAKLASELPSLLVVSPRPQSTTGK